MELVSVIIPVHNGEQFISRCLDSLDSQSYENIEMIIVDDASEDRTFEILKNRYGNENNVKIIRCDKVGGVSKARNIGLDCASGTYVMFCDADDVLHKNIVAIMVDSIEKNQVDMAVCGYQEFEKDNQIKFNPEYRYKTIILDKNQSIKCVFDAEYAGFVWNKIFKKRFIQSECIEFKEKISILEDQVFVLEYIKNINSSVFIKSDLYFYRINPHGALHSDSIERKLMEIDGRYEIYKWIQVNCIRKELLDLTWNDLMRVCVGSYYRLMFNDDKRNKCVRKWKAKIKAIIHEEKNKFILDSRWSRKYKLFYNCVKYFV